MVNCGNCSLGPHNCNLLDGSKPLYKLSALREARRNGPNRYRPFDVCQTYELLETTLRILHGID